MTKKIWVFDDYIKKSSMLLKFLEGLVNPLKGTSNCNTASFRDFLTSGRDYFFIKVRFKRIMTYVWKLVFANVCAYMLMQKSVHKYRLGYTTKH